MTNTDPFAPLASMARHVPHQATWSAVLPVPAKAPPPLQRHPRHGAPSRVYRYHDAQGRLLGIVCRFDIPGGGKEVLPQTFCRHVQSGKTQWRWQSWPVRRPLYGLDCLASRPNAPVIITEGEKAADAARILLPDCVVVSSPGGANAAGKADWQALSGRAIILWPDADAAGQRYADIVAQAAEAAGAASVRCIIQPRAVVAGWDAADALTEGWNTEMALRLVKQAIHWTPSDKKRTTARGSFRASRQPKSDAKMRPDTDGRHPAPRSQLLDLAEPCQLWHDPMQEPFASVPTGEAWETMALGSRRFQQWLIGRFFKATGDAPAETAVKAALEVLKAKALFDGPCHPTFLRCATTDDAVFVDLGNAGWQAAEVTACGVKLTATTPVRFIRSEQTEGLPEPEETDERIEDLLSPFIACDGEEGLILIIGWLIAALYPKGPKPILVLNGEQGSGKSTISRLLRSLVDPNRAPIRAMPRNEEDLFIATGHSWILAYDNLSGMPHWLSDALCRIATDGAFATRTLHTNREESVFRAVRPLILNGIADLTARPDLASRAMVVTLAAIPDGNRQPEDVFWAAWEKVRPRVFWLLLNALSSAVRHLPEVRLGHYPRMADLIKLMSAAEPGLDWQPGRFLENYRANQQDLAMAGFDSDPVAAAIRKHIKTAWEGTASELLTYLTERLLFDERKRKTWPATASALGTAVKRAASVLRAAGFSIKRRRGVERTLVILPPDPGA
jgi:putative DNA primase/helicase